MGQAEGDLSRSSIFLMVCPTKVHHFRKKRMADWMPYFSYFALKMLTLTFDTHRPNKGMQSLNSYSVLSHVYTWQRKCYYFLTAPCHCPSMGHSKWQLVFCNLSDDSNNFFQDSLFKHISFPQVSHSAYIVSCLRHFIYYAIHTLGTVMLFRLKQWDCFMLNSFIKYT